MLFMKSQPGAADRLSAAGAVKIVLPPALNEAENTLFKTLAEGSSFDPRLHFKEAANAS